MKHARSFLALLLTFALTLSPALAFSEGAVPETPAEPPITIYDYREGLAQATQGGLWGFVNTSGQVAIPIQYDSVVDFSLGTARVRKNGKMGLVRQDGLELLPTEYDTLKDIGFGLYLAQQGDAWGVVSLLSFSDGAGGLTHELYPISYLSAELTSISGLEILLLTGTESNTVVPLNDLPRIMVSKQIPSAQFPLIKGRIPSFSDAGPRDWFTVWVDLAYNLGLMEGVGGGRFAPTQTLTVAEVIKMAAYLESQANGDDFHLQPITATTWYSSSVAYCVATGIISSNEFTDYERPITRAELVHILSNTALGRRLPEVNSLSRVKASIPDVKPGDYAAESIYKFYAKGLLAGTDQNLTFNPNGRLTRAEAAAVVSRMARAEQRILLWDGSLPNTMTEQKLQVSELTPVNFFSMPSA